MVSESALDSQAFRAALGQFATGVTIITAVDEQDKRAGVTVNSFSSVSLDPPLVLWSLNRNSQSLPVYLHSESFTVNVLAANQIELSNHFARPGVADKFNGVSVISDGGQAPRIPDCAAWFRCEKRFTYEGGDHLIFVGEVQEFRKENHPPLLYHQGRYAIASAHPEVECTRNVVNR